MSVLSICLRFGILGVVAAGTIYVFQKFMQREEALSEEEAPPYGPIHINFLKKCLICHDDFEDNTSDDLRSVILPVCYHVFHKSCLEEWIRKGDSTCPICRRKIRRS